MASDRRVCLPSDYRPADLLVQQVILSVALFPHSSSSEDVLETSGSLISSLQSRFWKELDCFQFCILNVAFLSCLTISPVFK